MYDIWEVDRDKPIPPFEQLWNMIHPEDRESVRKIVTGGTPENNKIETEFRLLFPDGRIKYILLITTVFFDESGNLIKRQGVEIDITERKIAQLKLEEANIQIAERLREKEVLLRELHHRTKNNMQLISSLLGLKAAALGDAGIKPVFEDMQNRIRAVALVYDKLFQSQNLSSVNLKVYIVDLLQLLMRSYFHKKIKLLYDLDDIEVLIDVALPCGLIITELVLNSLKHAFPEDMSGYIEIKLKRLNSETIELIVSDSGVGLKDGDTDMEGRVGLQLFKSIAESQLDATVELKKGSGVTWVIRFNDNFYREEI
jgi:two-component sensor histidine kinase